MIDADTRITYPDGATTGSGRIVHVEPLGDGRRGVVLDETPAHPVDPTWPDQGPDEGMLEVDGVEHPLLDVRIGAWDGETLHLGDRLPARLGTEGWRFVVVHVVPESGVIAEGMDATVRVDEERRAALSTGHTACHLAALALNDALAGFWSKPACQDSLGHPDFDGAAVQSSLIQPNGSLDVYRLGKSLRKSGFDAATAFADGAALAALEQRVEATLAEWIAADSAVRIERDSPLLTARRTWVCELPVATATIPCGGTHLEHLGALGTLRVRLHLGEGGTELVMSTTAA